MNSLNGKDAEMERSYAKPRFTEKKFVITFIFVTSLFMLWGILRGGHDQSNDLDSVKLLYTVIGAVIFLIAILFYFVKAPSLKDPHVPIEAEKDAYAVPGDLI